MTARWFSKAHRTGAAEIPLPARETARVAPIVAAVCSSVHHLYVGIAALRTHGEQRALAPSISPGQCVHFSQQSAGGATHLQPEKLGNIQKQGLDARTAST